jgi:uncharacterized repeat protein (TIGR01451 family)
VAQPADGVADVQIAKHGPSTVTAGERITYTLVVTNRGPAPAQDVQVVDALPDGVTFVNATASQGTCAAAVNCQLGNLALNATATVTIVGVVDSATVSGTVLTNLAQVNSANEDPASANNTATAATTVEQLSNITLSKHATPATATAGSELTYQIVVTNAGPSMASGVVVSDALPAGFVLDSVTSSQGNCSALPCAVGDLAAGATVVVTIRGSRIRPDNWHLEQRQHYGDDAGDRHNGHNTDHARGDERRPLPGAGEHADEHRRDDGRGDRHGDERRAKRCGGCGRDAHPAGQHDAEQREPAEWLVRHRQRRRHSDADDDERAAPR